MQKNVKITFCALMAALAAVIMLTAYFPYLTYGIPAVAGLCTMISLIETNKKWAFASFLVSVLPIMLFCETEAKFLYLCFFGFYPILKAIIEKIKSEFLCFFIKIICFNFLMLLCYLGLQFIYGIPFIENSATVLLIAATIVLLNVFFIIYDILIAKLAVEYLRRLHPAAKKILYRK